MLDAGWFASRRLRLAEGGRSTEGRVHGLLAPVRKLPSIRDAYLHALPQLHMEKRVGVAASGGVGAVCSTRVTRQRVTANALLPTCPANKVFIGSCRQPMDELSSVTCTGSVLP